MVIKCEMCGSSLNANKAVDDQVTCEYCDTNTHISGRIHLNMSSDEKANALMKRGFVLIEFQVWHRAEVVFKKAVEYDPTNPRLYLGLLMVETKRTREEYLSLHNIELSTYESYQKAIEFGDEEQKRRLQDYNIKTRETHLKELKVKEKQQREIEEAREKQEVRRLKQKKMEKRKRIKRGIIITASLLFIVASYIALAERDRLEEERLAIENLERLTDLTFLTELVSQNLRQRTLDTRGLAYEGTFLTRSIRVENYVVAPDLFYQADFARVSFADDWIELDQVTRLSGIDLSQTAHQVSLELYERYGVEVEVFTRPIEITKEEQLEIILGGMNSVTASVVLSRLRDIGEPCPTRIEIRFEKNGVPVILKMIRSYVPDTSSWEETGLGVRTRVSEVEDFWVGVTQWTVVVGNTWGHYNEMAVKGDAR